MIDQVQYAAPRTTGDIRAEETVLAASAALEEARPWADKRPPVS